MSIEKCPKSKELFDALETVRGMCLGIEQARLQPELYARAASSVDLKFYTWVDKSTEIAAYAHFKPFQEMRRELGRVQCRESLARIAGDLESLRIMLPALTAAACVELGVLARALKDEANG